MYLFEAMPSSRSQEQIAQWYLDNDLGHYDHQLRHVAAKNWPLVIGNKRSTNMKVDYSIPREHLRLASMDVPNAVKDFANRADSVS